MSCQNALPAGWASGVETKTATVPHGGIDTRSTRSEVVGGLQPAGDTTVCIHCVQLGHEIAMI